MEWRPGAPLARGASGHVLAGVHDGVAEVGELRVADLAHDQGVGFAPPEGGQRSKGENDRDDEQDQEGEAVDHRR